MDKDKLAKLQAQVRIGKSCYFQSQEEGTEIRGFCDAAVSKDLIDNRWKRYSPTKGRQKVGDCYSR